MNAVLSIPLCAFVFSGWADRRYTLYLFVPTCLLMASAAVSIGGQGITPAHLMLGALAIACIRMSDGLTCVRHMLARTVPGIALLMLAIYGAGLAFFYPRIFPGSTYVNMFGSDNPLAFLSPPPLEPSSANVTQTIYIFGSFFTFFAVLALCDTAPRYSQLFKACLATVLVNIGFAAVDLVTYYTGTGFILDVVHNGNYVLRTSETAVLGLKRISGSFTETSAFSATTLGLFAFTLQLWLRGARKGLMLVLTAVQACLLILSTSSTGLGGLAVVLSVNWLAGVWRLLRARITPTEACFVIIFPLFALALALGATVFAPLHDVTTAVIQSLFLEKSQTESGVERLMLNAQAITNVFDSHGLGLGFGSVRTSSFALALIVSVGLPGALLFLAFLAAILFSKRDPASDWQQNAFQDACRMACFALLVAACISATSMDLNLLFFVFAAGAYWPEMIRLRRSERRSFRRVTLRVSPAGI